MKNLLIFLIVSVFLISFVSAVETSYIIVNDVVLAEHDFGSVRDLELRIPYDARTIEVNVNYDLEEFGEYKIVKINSGENVVVKYITESMIDKSAGDFYFIAKNYFDEPQNVFLTLPDSAILVEKGLVFPDVDEINSDGRSLILEWDDYSNSQIVVNYEIPGSDNLVFYLISIIIILSLIVFYVYEKMRFKRELRKVYQKNFSSVKRKTKEDKKKDLTINLFDDEKKIVEYLMEKKNNEAWTKEIFRDLGITKVRLSRKLKSLEKKELIKKIPYGNENKI